MGNPLDFCTVRRREGGRLKRVKRKYWQSEIQQQERGRESQWGGSEMDGDSLTPLPLDSVKIGKNDFFFA